MTNQGKNCSIFQIPVFCRGGIFVIYMVRRVLPSGPLAPLPPSQTLCCYLRLVSTSAEVGLCPGLTREPGGPSTLTSPAYPAGPPCLGLWRVILFPPPTDLMTVPKQVRNSASQPLSAGPHCSALSALLGIGGGQSPSAARSLWTLHPGAGDESTL